MLDVSSARVRDALYSARFGLERETLRVTPDGRMAKTPHPFPPDHPRIVRDFCENQVEINTSVHGSAQGAVDELLRIDAEVRAALRARPEPELLWPYSNPPPVAGEDDIPVARFDGPFAGKTAYRERLSEIYGRRRMAFCGVHVNVSFGADLLEADREAAGLGREAARARADALYVELAANAAENAWLLVALTAASPVCDPTLAGDPPGSVPEPGPALFQGLASTRCSELGYWNDFVPVFDYADAGSWARGVARYVEAGLIAAPTELYFPVRIKPRGPNRLEGFAESGVDRVELRMFDLNPFVPALVDARDVEFARLLLLRLAALPRAPHSARDQIRAVRNAKTAAHYDIGVATVLGADGRAVPVRDAALRALDGLDAFFAPLGLPPESRAALDAQREKLETPGARLAERARAAFSAEFAASVLARAGGGRGDV